VPILNYITMKQLIVLTFFLIATIIPSYGQDFEGTILYEISYENLPEEMKAMLPEENLQSMVYIKGTKTKTEMDMMGTKMIMISDTETNTTTSYTDVMGQKIKSTSAMDENEDLDIDLVAGETKSIAGYECKKAIIKQADSPDIEVYYSEDIKSSAFLSSQSQFKKLNGIPLEYQIQQEKMTMIYSAKKVERKSISSEVLNPPEGDYKKAPTTPK